MMIMGEKRFKSSGHEFRRCVVMRRCSLNRIYDFIDLSLTHAGMMMSEMVFAGFLDYITIVCVVNEIFQKGLLCANVDCALINRRLAGQSKYISLT